MTPAHDGRLGCDGLARLFTDAPIVQGCDSLKNGSLRLKTLFKYPNGSNIDIFVEKIADFLHPYRLSDYGNTAEFLINMGMDPWATRKRRKTVDAICASVGVYNEDKEFAIRFAANEIPFTSEALVRLAQACISVAGLHLTKRYRSVGLFREEFEERVLADRIDYESDYEIPGRFGNVVRVDFKVTGKRSSSLLQIISTSNSSAAHQVATEMFAKWFDLQDKQGEFQFLTVYDSESPVVRDEDIQRLGAFSTVLAFPAQTDAIMEALAA